MKSIFTLLTGVFWAARMAHGSLGDSVVVFNEVHYHPTGHTQDTEFVELHNQLSVNVDMSGWRIDGGVTYDFPEGTVIPKRGYLVVTRDPAALQNATGFAGALGPFAGSLSDSGETLRLYNNANALRTRPQPGGGTVETTLAEWRLGEDDDGATGGAMGNGSTTGINGGWPLAKTGAPVYSSNAATGSALSMQFDGSSVYAAASQVAATDDIGMECWARPTALGSAGYSFVLSNGRTDNGGYAIVELGGRWAIVHNGVAVSGSGPSVVLDTWVRLRFQRQNGVSRLSVNGTDAGVSIGAAPSTPTLFHVGANTVTSGFEGYFTGEIDRVRFFAQTTAPSPPPEPQSYPQTLDRRRVMDELSYEDGGAWPVAPDGSGFTLAKIDPQWNGDAAHWAWSLQANGTPGAANFAALPTPWNESLPRLTFNEVSGADAEAGGFQLELVNHGAAALPLADWQIVMAETGDTFALREGSLAAGAYLTINESTLGFRPADNARLFLYSPERAQITDALRVAKNPRARQTLRARQWLEPATTSFGTINTFAPIRDVAINEIFYHAFDNGPEQWIELKNIGPAAVRLDGWKLSGAVGFTFPANTLIEPGGLLVIAWDSVALLEKYPGRRILGPWSGRLSDEGERIVLEDAAGNPVDEVNYGTQIRWPEFADRGGASLELRDARADNAIAESWAASSTAALGKWETITYSEVATNNGLGNDAFRDFLLGMLDAGEILLDDVSVCEDPGGTNIEFIQNGDFENDGLGVVPAAWRCIGNHGQRLSVVVSDPDNPANKCLKVVATGNTDDKHNRIETTFATGRRVVVGRNYQISFRVRWMGGANQVNTRLYFDFLQRTTLLQVASQWGTPGAENSAAIANVGPTVHELLHFPTIPPANTPVAISAALSDPDTVASAQIFYRVNSGAWTSAAMSAGEDGRWSGTVPGAAASATVQFYLRATDGAGTVAEFPAAGANGGCFYKVNDNAADRTGLRTNLRVIVKPEVATGLFTSINRMSNAMFPCTVIEDERTVYYQALMRLKGSASGRYGSDGVGFNLKFNDDQPFRGRHGSIAIDRHPAYREVLAKQMLNRAGGGYWSHFDDIGKIIGPSVNGFGMIAAARTSRQFVTGLFPGSGTGTLFNHELLYQPNAADANGFKINNPYNHTRGIYDLADRGADKEVYRWGWQIRSKRRNDDYSSMVRLNQAFGLTGAAFEAEIEDIIDVDQFMRTWAIMALYGNDDQYGRLYEHNWRLYDRPTDGKFIALPWDLDRAFLLATNASLIPTVNANGQPQAIQRLFTVPRWKRLFDSHLLDIVATTANTQYLSSWASHLGTAVGVSLASYATYAQARGTYALTRLPTVVPFEITTNGGADFSTPETSVVLAGRGWVDVYSIHRDRVAEPLEVTWTGADTWNVSLPIRPGQNVIALTAKDQRLVERGTDTIIVTGTGTVAPASADTMVVSELHYHPADPTADEIAAGFTDERDFEFIEIQNISDSFGVDFTGVRFDSGIAYSFAAGTLLAPGEKLVIPRRSTAFALRHPGVATAPEYFLTANPTGNQFSNGGELISIVAADGSPIKSFTYDDAPPWPVAADGAGRSLVLISPHANPDHSEPLSWRASFATHGNPGTTDGTPFTGDPNADSNEDGLQDLVNFAIGGGARPFASGVGADGRIFTVERDAAAQAAMAVETSTDLSSDTWRLSAAVLLTREPVSGTVERLVFAVPEPTVGSQLFVRVRFTLTP